MQGDLSDMVVGARWPGLSISETAEVLNQYLIQFDSVDVLMMCKDAETASKC